MGESSSDSDKGIITRYFKDLISYMPRDVALSVALMVAISLTEGISLLILIPLLQLVGLDVAQGALGQFASVVANLFAFLNITPTLVLVLAIYVLIISFSTFLSRWQTLRTSRIQYEFAAHLRKSLYKAITHSG